MERNVNRAQRRAEKATTSKTADGWQKGDLFVAVSEGLVVFGEALSRVQQHPAGQYVNAMAFSHLCPEGEVGPVPLADMQVKLSREEYDAFRAAGWPCNATAAQTAGMHARLHAIATTNPAAFAAAVEGETTKLARALVDERGAMFRAAFDPDARDVLFVLFASGPDGIPVESLTAHTRASASKMFRSLTVHRGHATSTGALTADAIDADREQPEPGFVRCFVMTSVGVVVACDVSRDWIMAAGDVGKRAA
jgi:hypothetical protein